MTHPRIVPLTCWKYRVGGMWTTVEVRYQKSPTTFLAIDLATGRRIRVACRRLVERVDPAPGRGTGRGEKWAASGMNCTNLTKQHGWMRWPG